jgi:hypothetical protein
VLGIGLFNRRGAERAEILLVILCAVKLDRREGDGFPETRAMKSFTTTLLALLFLGSASSAFAKAAKKTYFGSYKGHPCTVQMTWHNWDGLGPIDGVIMAAGGAVVPFSGSNSQPGVIELQANGESLRLTRSGAGKASSWTSSKLSITEGAPAPTPSPTPKSSPSPSPQEVLTNGSETVERMVDETYTGSWRGQEFTARIRWAPGDEPGILRRGRGTITMASGRQVSIEASQPSVDAAEFSIKPDETGETYKTTKTTRDGTESWESSSLTLTGKK